MKEPQVDRMRDVDAALRLLGTAEPRAGLERRVQARLALAQTEQPAWWRLGRWELGGAVAAVCAIFAALALHGGAFTRQNTVAPPLQSTAPIIAPIQPGLSTAAGRATPLAGVPVHASGRARQHRTGAGRAAIARNAHRASGVVLPGTPVPIH
jgi:hypothetical protein